MEGEAADRVSLRNGNRPRLRKVGSRVERNLLIAEAGQPFSAGGTEARHRKSGADLAAGNCDLFHGAIDPERQAVVRDKAGPLDRLADGGEGLAKEPRAV